MGSYFESSTTYAEHQRDYSEKMPTDRMLADSTEVGQLAAMDKSTIIGN